MPARSRKAARPRLRFSGPPRRVQALVPASAASLAGAIVTVSIGDGSVDIPSVVVPFAPGSTAIRLVPTETLPAGTFAGTLAVGEQAWEADVEVLEWVKSRVYPARIRIDLAGSEVIVDLVNLGNVDIAIQKAYAIPLEQAGVLSRAIAAGIGAKDGGAQRWAAAADSVAADHVGIARVSIRDGAGPVPPGQAARITGALRLPERLATGTTYIGKWRLPGASVALRVTPTGEE